MESKRYWLRGGFIGLGVFAFWVSALVKEGFGPLLSIFAPGIWWVFSWVLLTGIDYYSLPVLLAAMAIAILFCAIPYIFIGGLCGYIYGKTAYRKTAGVLFVLAPALIFPGIVYRYSPVSRYCYTSRQSCETFSFERFRKDFDVEDCYYTVAEKLKDPSMCDLVGDNAMRRETCLLSIAKDLQDFTVCDRLEDTRARDECIERVALDRGECEKINGSWKDACYQTAAYGIRVSARDNSCDELKQAESRELCERYRMNKITTEVVCDKIVNPFLKSECMKPLY